MKLRDVTVSMQQIAEAAQVSRQAVTVWRRRGGDPSHQMSAFPAPVRSGRGPRFQLEEVREWFRSTGSGNHSEVLADLPLHSLLMERLTASPEESSALLVLATILGVPLVPQLQDLGGLLGQDRLRR